METCNRKTANGLSPGRVRYQVPRYSGWKLRDTNVVPVFQKKVRYQVPRYSGWKQQEGEAAYEPAVAASDTKYRDIADGNESAITEFQSSQERSDTKYRDIADGNFSTAMIPRIPMTSDTKYRDIADGNGTDVSVAGVMNDVRYQVPRYSGWKLSSIKKRAVGTAGQIPSTAIQRMETVALLQNILAHLRGWKPSTAIQRMETACDHKHVHAGPQVGNQVPGYSK